ncbi:MAG: hypothetical protein OEW42_17050 [Acidimicrobiia bacterium]|nr:hypothetical protein [Acidimicrobiia bacterium]MDH5237595.1 hypothetical protein [Acidimicrobiia bacterium]
MPELRFEGDTHAELVSQVRAWLGSIEAEGPSLAGVVDQSAALTKDSLRLLAEAAPGELAGSDVVSGLTDMGYKMTDATRDRVLNGLDLLAKATDGTFVGRATKGATDASAKVLFSMNSALAKQFLKQLNTEAD